jgi:membrane-bound lytic murein transglycosylase D
LFSRAEFSFFFIIIAAVLFPIPCDGTQVSCIAPHLDSLKDGFRYGLPPNVEKNGLSFAGQTIDVSRADIRYRLIRDINHLLQDRRSKALYWLTKAESLKPIIGPILVSYELPPEFIYLSAIESSFNPRAVSSAGAYGYWQFIKKTAQGGCAGCGQYDWKMGILGWKDQRADLRISSHAAARYLSYMNRVQKMVIGDKSREGFQDWLLTAAAYNAGPQRILNQLKQFRADSYWDVPLPAETERYVPRWMALSLISKYRDFYGIHVPAPKPVSFDTVEKVKLEKDLPLTVIAKIVDSTPLKIWHLNSEIFPEPGFFPAKSGRAKIDHVINIPKGTKTKFLAQLAAQGYTKHKK